MKRLALAAAAVAALIATPSSAALKPGDKAPDFQAPAFLAGNAFTYKLADARKKGLVVLYFFPSAYTGGCNAEAHAFSEAIDQYKAQKATVIGVTAGKVAELAKFSADTTTCGGKFPVAADADLAIAKQYDAVLVRNGQATPFSDRTSYVIGPDGKVLLAFTNLSNPNAHITETLAAVKAYRAKRR